MPIRSWFCGENRSGAQCAGPSDIDNAEKLEHRDIWVFGRRLVAGRGRAEGFPVFCLHSFVRGGSNVLLGRMPFNAGCTPGDHYGGTFVS